MAMTKDDLREVFAELLKAEEPKEKVKEELKPTEKSEELKTLEDRLAELEAELEAGKKKESEKDNENPATKDPVKTKDDDVEDDEKTDLHNRIIAGEILKGVSTSGFDEKVLSDVMSLFAYDKLKGEDGSADDEKIATLVDALTSLALREPPKGGGTKKVYDPADEGLSKYL